MNPKEDANGEKTSQDPSYPPTHLNQNTSREPQQVPVTEASPVTQLQVHQLQLPLNCLPLNPPSSDPSATEKQPRLRRKML
jgi:hypothetical protein